MYTKIEKVFLMNKNWLLNYKFNEIFSLIMNNNEIKNIILTNNLNIDTDSQIFNNIISKLDQIKINEIDKSIFQSHNSFSIDANYENIQLLNQKSIKIYKKFILINENMYELLKKNFTISTNSQIFHYIHKNIDILSINDFEQKTILFGKIDKSNNCYDIKYIFEYKSFNNVIQTELKEIETIGPESYFSEKTVFNANNINDCISPIFFSNNKEILGNCYKYNNNINYNKCIDYTDFLSSKNLIKVLSLYKNYKKMKENIKYMEDKYYLINKAISTVITY